MTTQRQMNLAYVAQQEVIDTLRLTGERSGHTSRPLHDSTPIPAPWRRMAIHVPICRMHLVPPTDDAGVVGRDATLVVLSNCQPRGYIAA
jgi:hypothetical protein